MAPTAWDPGRLEAWRDYVTTPWGRVRYAVVGEVLRRHLVPRGRRLRVLDVGGGDGQDALPLALAGHDVTILDPAPGWLDEAGRRAAEQQVVLSTRVGGLDDLPDGEWDLVLCHFVLRYRPAGADDVAALAHLVAPDGLLSVVDVNPAARVLRILVSDGPGAAMETLEVLGEGRIDVPTFGTEARTVDPEVTLREASRHGLVLEGRYGTRIATDLLLDEQAKRDPAYFDRLLALELALCDRLPFRDIGFVWQLVLGRAGQRAGQRPQSGCGPS